MKFKDFFNFKNLKYIDLYDVFFKLKKFFQVTIFKYFRPKYGIYLILSIFIFYFFNFKTSNINDLFFFIEDKISCFLTLNSSLQLAIIIPIFTILFPIFYSKINNWLNRSKLDYFVIPSEYVEGKITLDINILNKGRANSGNCQLILFLSDVEYLLDNKYIRHKNKDKEQEYIKKAFEWQNGARFDGNEENILPSQLRIAQPLILKNTKKLKNTEIDIWFLEGKKKKHSRYIFYLDKNENMGIKRKVFYCQNIYESVCTI